MEINRALLQDATEQGVLSAAQAEQLWQFLGERSAATPGFRVTHILYYLGGLIAIGAMSLFMTLGWESFGGVGLLAIALAYAVAGLWLTNLLLARGLRIPAGISAAFVVALTPLAVYGLQSALGWWAEGRVYRDLHSYVDWRWIMLELATLPVGAVLLWRYRLPFLVLPVAVTLWYLSMDLTPFIAGADQDWGWELRKLVSLWFGLLMVLLAFWVDLRSRRAPDFAFWLYLFGVLAFWGGLSLLQSDSELNKFLYFCINLLLIVVGSALGRRVFVVFGGIGAAGYLGYLAYHVFEDSLLFPFALTAIGGAVIYAGILWQRHEDALGSRLRNRLPPAVRTLLDNRS
ncbi:MAG TPA: DUF2157 domain-containing protein [Burkholderiaceae bacterium]|nr:DUF2157 domain-containing protein [Burkholderiaceae bacterium]